MLQLLSAMSAQTNFNSSLYLQKVSAMAQLLPGGAQANAWLCILLRWDIIRQFDAPPCRRVAGCHDTVYSIRKNSRP